MSVSVNCVCISRHELKILQKKEKLRTIHLNIAQFKCIFSRNLNWYIDFSGNVASILKNIVGLLNIAIFKLALSRKHKRPLVKRFEKLLELVIVT